MALMAFLSKRETRSQSLHLQTAELRQTDHHATLSEKRGGKLSRFFSLLSSLSHPSPIFLFLFLILNQGILAEWTSGLNKVLEAFIFIWCHRDARLYSRTRCEMAIPSPQQTRVSGSDKFGSLQSYLATDASPVFQEGFIAQRPITSSASTCPVLIYLPLKYKKSIQE